MVIKDLGGKTIDNTNWHESQKEAIKKKWVYSPEEAIELLNKMSKQNAEMLGMLKRTQRILSTSYVDGNQMDLLYQIDALVKKVEG